MHMRFPRTLVLLMAVVVGLGGRRAATADEAVSNTEISPGVLLFQTSSGNVIASVGRDGAVLVGTPSAGSTAAIAKVLAGKTTSPVRYVVVFPEDPAHSDGDAGWGRRGAFVAMQEKALERLGGHAMGPPVPLPSRLTALGVDRPRVAFSDVLTFDVNGDAIHVVHQAPGYSDADAIVHFHTAHLVYLGEVFPGDGYPTIDTNQGGRLSGVLKTLGAWAGGAIHVVPARGDVKTGAEVKEFRDMIVTVRDRVQSLMTAGKTEEQVVEAHPTTEFDGKWGHGRVTPAAFISELYTAIRAQ